MRAHDAVRQSRQTGVGDIDKGNAGIVSIRPRAGIVEQLRAVGLSVELTHLGRHVVPVVTTRSPS